MFKLFCGNSWQLLWCRTGTFNDSFDPVPMLPRNLDPFFSLNITKSERYLETTPNIYDDLFEVLYKKDFIHVKISVIFFMLLYGTLTLSWRRSLSYRNQSIYLQSKSIDWFLYDRYLRHEGVKLSLGLKELLQLNCLTPNCLTPIIVTVQTWYLHTCFI